MNTTLSYNDIPHPLGMERVPSRPLGSVSSFVCERMPDLLAQIERREVSPNKLPLEIDAAVASITVDVRDFSRDQAMLAFLDCGMSEAAIGKFKLGAPDNLTRLTNDLSARVGQYPGLRYEPLMRANPLETDPRLFSPTHGQGELLFYQVHLRIEHVAADAVRTMRSILARLDQQSLHNEGEVISEIDSVTAAVDAIRDYMQVLIDHLLPEDFLAIRGYYNNATRTATGPSGKDSAGIFVLDTLVAGDDPKFRRFLESKMDTKLFYPTTTVDADGFAGQTDMTEALEQSAHGKTLQTLSKPLQSLTPVVAGLLRSIQAMRARHMAVGKRFLPDAFKPDAPIFEGTGGIGVHFPDYLKIPIEALRALQNS